jgi:two-component system response regulator (stage 0 sporulation protein F)
VYDLASGQPLGPVSLPILQWLGGHAWDDQLSSWFRARETTFEAPYMSLPILVVDDDPDAGAIMAKLFTAFGYDAEVARDGASALRMIEQKRFGIAIIDYRMPGMNGVELLRRMRELHSELAAIFLTGYTTIDVVYPAIEAGVLRVLAKPADFQELIPIVREHLGEGSAGRGCAIA